MLLKISSADSNCDHESEVEIHGIDPKLFLTNVLIRIQFHPQSRIDELLPHLWKAPG